MEKCQICGEDLYQVIGFYNLLKDRYTVHLDCKNSLVINSDREAFPMSNKLVYYDYLFYNINESYNNSYIESKYLHILFERNLVQVNWSVIIFYEEGLFASFDGTDIDILFSLANMPVLIISILYKDMSTVFNENI